MSKESHSFSVSVACEVGVNCSIILQHFIFLQRFSPDGWVKKPAKAIKETYQYMTEKEIRGAIDRLCRDGYVFDKIENAVKADRTKSFFVTDSGHKLYGTEPFDKKANGVPKRANGFDERANDNFPKGQMLIKEDCIVNSSIVGGSAPAPVYIQSLEVKKIESSTPPDGPRWQDVPNSNTPREFETYMTRFYANHPQELEYIRERTQFQNNPTGVPAAIADFCAWAVGEGWNRRTLQQINARFGRWLRDQTRFEQKKQGKKNEFKFRSPETITDALDFAARWQREQELGIPH